jgi:hypothetical protein
LLPLRNPQEARERRSAAIRRNKVSFFMGIRLLVSYYFRLPRIALISASSGDIPYAVLMEV